MEKESLNQLKKQLWEVADELRANTGLKASAYSTPVLGLIFLKFADAKYAQYEDEIKQQFEALKGGRRATTTEEITLDKCGYYLHEHACDTYTLNLSEEENIASKIKEAMEAIERYSPEFVDVLPKDSYHDLSTEDNNKILNRLLRNFNDIPVDTEHDIFGEVYEYFLGEFALAEGQGGGEFYTPRSVVRYMVEVLQPSEGKI